MVFIRRNTVETLQGRKYLHPYAVSVMGDNQECLRQNTYK